MEGTLKGRGKEWIHSMDKREDTENGGLKEEGDDKRGLGRQSRDRLQTLGTTWGVILNSRMSICICI